MPRFRQYDILKGIGILLVITCHAGLDGFPKEFIYTFHMPLFFFVSGCFYKEMPFSAFVKKNARQLIVPYLLFVIFAIFIQLLRSSDFLAFGKSLNLNPFNESDPCLFESIWFLICLFNVRMIYYAIKRFCKGNILNVIMLSSILHFCGYVFAYAKFNIPFFIDTAFSVVIFYALGDVFFRYYQKIATLLFNKGIILLGILLCSIVCMLLHPKVELKENIFPFYLIFISIPMIIIFYYLSLVLAKFKSSYIVLFLESAGVSSLCILGFHNSIFLVIGPYLRMILSPIQCHIIKILFLVLITVFIVFFIEKVINKYTPYLLGKF